MKRTNPRLSTAAYCLVSASVATQILLSCEAIGAPPSGDNDRGSFVFTLAGQQIGTESFEIRTQKGQVEATSKVDLRVVQEGKTLDFRTSAKLTLTSDLVPQTYEWDQKGAQSSRLEVDLRSTPAAARYRTVAGGDDVREFNLPRNVLILDSNVIHHFELALMRFRRAGGSKQTFPAFVPQQALPGSLSIEEIGPENVEIDGKTKKLRHLVLTTENAQIDLWADGQERLQKLSIPAAGLEVIRQK
jgi:hypothetical protein